jgi:hypothetical protein
METYDYIKSNQILYSSGNNHSLYSVKLKKVNIKKWGKNRDPEMERVKEIKKSIKDNTFVYGIIYIGEIDKEFFCYDGMHRLKAYQELQKEEHLQLSFRILIDVMFDTTDEEIKQSFININKALTVPELYLDDEDGEDIILDQRKSKILSLVKELNDQYKDFFSSSSKPNRPNTNRDILTDDILEIWKKYPSSSIEDIRKNLFKLNKMYIKKLIGRDDNEKCEKAKFYIFVKKNISLDDYEYAIKNKN